MEPATALNPRNGGARRRGSESDANPVAQARNQDRRATVREKTEKEGFVSNLIAFLFDSNDHMEINA